MSTRAIESLRSACATGRDCQTVTVRRGHLRWLLDQYDRMRGEAAVAEVRIAALARCDHAATCGLDLVCELYEQPPFCPKLRGTDAFEELPPHPVSAAGGEGERKP